MDHFLVGVEWSNAKDDALGLSPSIGKAQAKASTWTLLSVSVHCMYNSNDHSHTCERHLQTAQHNDVRC